MQKYKIRKKTELLLGTKLVEPDGAYQLLLQNLSDSEDIIIDRYLKIMPTGTYILGEFPYCEIVDAVEIQIPTGGTAALVRMYSDVI